MTSEIVYPPESSIETTAYIANIEDVRGRIDSSKSRSILIDKIQKVDDAFDPGFLLREAIVNTDDPIFLVQLFNPSMFPLTVREETAFGFISCFDPKVIDENPDLFQAFGKPTQDDKQKILREGILLATSRDQAPTDLYEETQPPTDTPVGTANQAHEKRSPITTSDKSIAIN